MASVFSFRSKALPLAAGGSEVTCRVPYPFVSGTKRSRHRVLHRRIVTKAKQNEESGSLQLPAILKIANGVTNSAANLIPATVPRPVAKFSVVGVCGILALWLFGKVVSTLFTVVAVGGAIYLFVKSKGSTETTDNGEDPAADDPLASARRILDKYK